LRNNLILNIEVQGIADPFGWWSAAIYFLAAIAAVLDRYPFVWLRFLDIVIFGSSDFDSSLRGSIFCKLFRQVEGDEEIECARYS